MWGGGEVIIGVEAVWPGGDFQVLVLRCISGQGLVLVTGVSGTASSFLFFSFPCSRAPEMQPRPPGLETEPNLN